VINRDRALTINAIGIPVLAVAAITALCYFAAPILVPLVTAIVLAYVLSPAVAVMRRLKLPHWLAVIVVMLLTVILIFFIGMLIYGQARDLVDNVPSYWEQIEKLHQQLLTENPWLGEIGLPAEAGDLLDQVEPGQISAASRFFFKLTGGALSFIGSMMLVLLMTLFILIEQRGLTRRLQEAFGSGSVDATSNIIRGVSQQLAGYIQVRAVTTLALAVIFTVGLIIGGVTYAWVWGPLAALLGLIPYVGAFIGAIPPMIMAAIEAGALLPMVWVFAFFMAVQFVESNLITPKMLGDHLNISLLAQLLATIFWGWLWGAIGIFLAIPITAALKVVCDNIEPLKPIGVILSGDRR
jgi:predicted PurR-regulated permease PerM